MKRREKGFTLIEIILVIAILGICAAMALPKFFDARAQAEDVVVKQVQAHIETTILALQTRYILTNQSYDAQDIIDNLNLQGMTITIENL